MPTITLRHEGLATKIQKSQGEARSTIWESKVGEEGRCGIVITIARGYEIKIVFAWVQGKEKSGKTAGPSHLVV